MNLRHLTDLYFEISWRATSYGLSCARVVQKRETSTDRKRLAELGDKILNALRLGSGNVEDKSYDGCFIDSLQGRLLAVVIEEEYLRADNKSGGECAEGLRKLGIDSLEKLADVLKIAENKNKFDEYASHLQKFFYGWHGYAEECYALDTPPIWPPTIGNAVAKVINRQSA